MTSVVTFKLVMHQLGSMCLGGPYYTGHNWNVDHVDFDSWAKRAHQLWIEVLTI